MSNLHKNLRFLYNWRKNQRFLCIFAKADLRKFKVELYTNLVFDNTPISDQVLKGSGVYSAFSQAHIEAMQFVEDDILRGIVIYPIGTYSLSQKQEDATTYMFEWWNGADVISNQISQSILVNKNITATAYYFEYNPVDSPDEPCIDKEKNLANPLAEMKVAKSGPNNLEGGTYGDTRNGGRKKHNGLDLYAEEGTPVFAMIDGEIWSGTYIIEQPNRDKNGNYPIDYGGDDDSAGNRIYITGTSPNGVKVRVGFFHLQAGNPVAVNPRTGDLFKPGDKVYAGDLIGYTGMTGNANKTYTPHLHIQCYDNTGLINPETLLNGNLDWENKKLKKPEVINKKCND